MFTFKVVEDYKKLPKEYFHFRYKIIHDELKLVEDDTKELDFDEYDKYSVHFIVYDTDNKICATTRMILNSDLGLPTPNHLDIEFNEKGIEKNFAELSRVFVDKKYRSFQNTKEILLNFAFLIYQNLLLYRIDFIYASMEKNFLRFFSMINIHFQTISDPIEHYGLRYPCIISAKKLIYKNPYIK